MMYFVFCKILDTKYQILLYMDEQTFALDAIRKKLIGKELNYKEIFAIMDEIAN